MKHLQKLYIKHIIVQGDYCVHVGSEGRKLSEAADLRCHEKIKSRETNSLQLGLEKKKCLSTSPSSLKVLTPVSTHS